jgi:hypothetical protein
MEAAGSSETQVTLYHSAWHHITENHNFNSYQAQTIPRVRLEKDIRTNCNSHPNTKAEK